MFYFATVTPFTVGLTRAEKSRRCVNFQGVLTSNGEIDLPMYSLPYVLSDILRSPKQVDKTFDIFKFIEKEPENLRFVSSFYDLLNLPTMMVNQR